VSPEERELIRSIYDALNRRDIAALRAQSALSPDFEWRSAPEEPDFHLRRGASEAMAHSEELLETFDRLDLSIEREIDAGPDRVIFEVRVSVRGVASGAAGERREFHLWTAEGGRPVSLYEFSTLDEAMEVAG
jgi:ketosteroid isomerase-like protein